MKETREGRKERKVCLCVRERYDEKDREKER
jgi:hypothetical protein